MKTKEEIIAVIDSPNHLSCDDTVAIKHYLQLNPMRIDEERFISVCPKNRFTVVKEEVRRYVRDAIKEYNSDLPEPLVRLPEEIPFEVDVMLTRLQEDIKYDRLDFWRDLICRYCTLPTKKDEWWQTCKKFKYNHVTYNCTGYKYTKDGFFLLDDSLDQYPLSSCQPYTEPSIHDIAREKLGDELYEKLMQSKTDK